MKPSWSDARLDDLSGRMEKRFDDGDRRFDRVDARFDRIEQRFERVDEKFERIDARFDALNRTLLQVGGGIVVGLVGVIATQL